MLFATHAGTAKTWANWLAARLGQKVEDEMVIGSVANGLDESELVFFCVASGLLDTHPMAIIAA